MNSERMVDADTAKCERQACMHGSVYWVQIMTFIHKSLKVLNCSITTLLSTLFLH